jgi:uncharacterized protein YkwD
VFQNERTPPRQASRSRLRVFAAGVAAVAVFGASIQTGGALAANCPGGSGSPTKASRGEITRATLCLVNAERGGQGLRPLRLSRRLSVAARGHSRDMVRRHYFGHTAPDGSTLVERVRSTGYLNSARRWLVGENIGWGEGSKGTVRAIVQAWMHSPRHREAILSPSFRDAGIGVVRGVPTPGASGGATYTLDFGVKH